jgi:hypothetical protein
MKKDDKVQEHVDCSQRPHGVSRRDFLVSLLVASGAVIVGPTGLLAAMTDVQAAGKWPADWPKKEKPLVIDSAKRIVKMYTEISLKHLSETTAHWGIGCMTGKYADKFILISPAEPLDFHDALVRVGARPGNNLALDSYGKFVDGDELIVTAQWLGLKKPVGIGDIFYDQTGKGFLVRFGGNRTTATEKKTGCLTCLESCPISITSNAVYPNISGAQRMIKPNSRFRGKPEILPQKDSFPVVVYYRLGGRT